MNTVSAVIPFHNAAATIVRALDSLAQQAHPLTEIIVVDDASAPEEHSALSALAAAWPADRPALRVHRLAANAGPATARNVGWDLATGSWIAFCDADDVWHPQRLASQLSVADDAALVTCRRASSPSRMGATSGVAPSRRITRRELLAWNPVVTSAVLVRASVDTRFTPGRRYSEDYEAWLRIELGGGVLRMVEQALVAPQIPDSEAQGLSTHRWKMTRGEWQTYGFLRREGLLGPWSYGTAMGVSTLRAGRRHALDLVNRVRKHR